MRNKILFTASLLVLLILSAASRSFAGQTLLVTKLADVAKLFPISEPAKMEGVITQVIYWQYSDFNTDPDQAVVLRIAYKGGDFLAYIGPKPYLENRGITFKVGDNLEMEGVMANVNGQSMLVASNISDTWDTLLVRDEVGKLGR